MPMDLQTYKRGVATATVDYGDGDTITVSYRPAFVTEKTIAQFIALNDGETTAENAVKRLATVNRLILCLLISWDLTNGGAPVPLTEDDLGDVPIEIRADILRTIFGGSQMDPTTGTPTPPTSPATSARARRTSSGKSASQASRRSSRTSN